MHSFGKQDIINIFNIDEVFLNSIPSMQFVEKALDDDFILVIKNTKDNIIIGVVIPYNEYYYWHSIYYTDKLLNGYTKME
jgi:hypothetical protein